jgi:uncharacterized protein (DUF1330 family)
MAAYLMSLCKITNPHDNFKKYVKISGDMLKEYGGTYVVRGPADSVYEGDYLNGPVVIIAQFESMDKLKGFVESDAYQKDVKPLRDGSGIYDVACYEEAPQT